jgi:hypothetical protein
VTDFFKQARSAGAAEYGRARAERYGRRAKAARVLGVLAAGALLLATVAAAHGAFGG